MCFNPKSADIEYTESLLTRVLEGVKETFDIFAGGTGEYYKKYILCFII